MRNTNYYDEGSRELIAFVAGALIGAGVALLLTPQRGTELRGHLRDYANRAKDDLMDIGQEALNTAVERGTEYYRRGEDAVRDMGRAAREFAQHAQDLAEGKER